MSDKQYIKTLEDELEKLRCDKEASIQLAEQNEQLKQCVKERDSKIHSLRCEVRRLEDELYKNHRPKTAREIVDEQKRYYDSRSKYYQYGNGYTYDDPKKSNPFYDLWSEDDEKPEPKKKKK